MRCSWKSDGSASCRSSVNVTWFEFVGCSFIKHVEIVSDLLPEKANIGELAIGLMHSIGTKLWIVL